MGGGKTAAIVLSSLAGACGVAAAVLIPLLLRGSKGGAKGVRPAIKRLHTMLSRKNPSWFDSLPLIKLTNKTGMEVTISSVGAAITRMVVPDKAGRKVDVVLGYEDIQSYVSAEPVTYFGVVVGRCANRIAKGLFQIGEEAFSLVCNNGENHLHGGTQGLHKRRWQAVEFTGETFTGVELQYESYTGEEGYPGNLFITVTYKLSKFSNELSTTITATTDEPTPVNIAQHSYFNLAGHNSTSTILDHELIIKGDHYTPVTPSLIPTGQILPVAGTPFDFTEPHTIGERIDKVPGGYDHNYVLFGMGPQARFICKNGMASDKPRLAATLKDPKSGRCMDVLTTAPGLQFYSGNFLDGVKGKAGAVYPKHQGLCLETQGFPDAINQSEFPSVVLKPEETYRHDIIYKFY